jgi:hypothetical protein
MIKSIEISLAIVVCAYGLRDLEVFSIPISYGIGVFVGALIIYWVPPSIEMKFRTWLAISATLSVLVFWYTKMVLR